jgi:hypothetical protein
MKQYKEVHYEIGTDESGERAWINGKQVREVSLEDKHAEDINAQFHNTGIRLETYQFPISLPESEPVTEEVIITDELVAEYPNLTDHGFKIGDKAKKITEENGLVNFIGIVTTSSLPNNPATEETPDTNQ